MMLMQKNWQINVELLQLYFIITGGKCGNKSVGVVLPSSRVGTYR